MSERAMTRGKKRTFAAKWLFLITASCWVGCLPASRVQNAATKSGKDGALIEEAKSADNLSPSQRKILIVAEDWLGTPYLYGGISKKGTDCSGFVYNVFAVADVQLPRTSRDQSTVGAMINDERIQPGDLVFFNTTGDGVSHVGIAIGNDKFIHASTSKGVIISSLEEEYYRKRFLFARRLL
ncbi:MAG: C40 family peptidase [Chlorobi bacterium]|nr:C40 family peptidase [Chlorobiota bacterium]